MALTLRRLRHLFFIVAIAHLAVHAEQPCKLKPSGSVSGPCGLRITDPLDSTFYAYYGGLPQDVTSVDECASLCARRRVDRSLGQVNSENPYSAVHEWCTGFFVTQPAGYCQLLASPVEDAAKHPSKTGDTLLYSGNCFDCGNPCPQPVGKQLIDDGAFEEKLLGPWVSTNGSVAFGNHSRNMYQCDSRTETIEITETIVCDLKQFFNHCPNTFYSVSFDYKLPPALVGFQQLQVMYSSDWLHTAIIPSGQVDTAWKTVTGFFQGDPKTDVHDGDFVAGLSFEFAYPRLNSTPKGLRYDIDNVRVTRIPDKLAAKPGSTSIVANGGFESGRLAPWFFARPSGAAKTNFTIISPGIRSKRAIQIFPGQTTQLADLEESFGYLTQSIATQPGMQYLVTFDYASSMAKANGQIQPVGYTVKLSGALNPDGQPANVTVLPFVPPANASAPINSASIPFLALENRTNLGIFLSTPINVRLPQSVVIDNISVKQLSERLG